MILLLLLHLKLPATMKFIYASAVLALLATACNNQSAEETAETPATEEAQITLVENANYYGDTIAPEKMMSPDELYTAMNTSDSVYTAFEATINETCKMKGCWMTLDMGNDREMRVTFKDYGFFVPTEGMEGKRVILEGFAHRDTLSVDHLRHLAEDAGKTPEEIAAINEPEVGVNFEAVGVIIRN